ncbi:MAG: hypothetical protein QNK37_04505 [Acidobacteriota bacterium]|nr:hypothetical protein [Acidobacteriota bacterium]
MNNPFFFGPPVHHSKFLGRKGQTRRIVNLVGNNGQSVAISGTYKVGKTPLMRFLLYSENRSTHFENFDKLCFQFMDMQLLPKSLDHKGFWREATRPLGPFLKNSGHANLEKALVEVEQNGFPTPSLKDLFESFSHSQIRLVLFIDEFDVLLHRPKLNNNRFFGSLRSLATLSEGALALVIGTHKGITALNKETEEHSSGSPYFNHFNTISLGCFKEKSLDFFSDREDHHLLWEMKP